MRIFAKTAGDSHWDSFLKYEPATGHLYATHQRHTFSTPLRDVAGDAYSKQGPADLIPGCIVVYFFEDPYPAHRIVWRMCRGPIPKGKMVEHINRDVTDNRLSNLRLVDLKPKLPKRMRQKRVVSGKHSNNTSGYLGVIYLKRSRKWLARITVNGVRYDLGSYLSPEQASAAYQEAKKRKEKA